MKKIHILGSTLAFLAPLAAFAQTPTTALPGQGIVNIIGAGAAIINMLIPILISLAIVMFFWGLIKYVRSSGKDHTMGLRIMTAGLLSLFVMVTLWGILAFAASTLQIPGYNGIGAAPFKAPSVTP